METITGQITQILPDGGYQSQNGYISTFVMTIQGPNGPITGQIGSKSQTYPLSPGQTISVQVTEYQGNTRFKKFNPQYAQAASQSRQATNTSQRDYDKENRGKCRHGLYCACIAKGVSPDKLNMDTFMLQAIEGLVEKSMNGIGGIPNPDYSENPPEPDDDLRF